MNLDVTRAPADTDLTPHSQASRRTAVAIPGLLAVVFFAFHLPYRPAALEDLDSINFALGVREFNVAQHQPHPPGYPVYIFVAKAANAIASTETTALTGVSIVSGTLGVLVIAVFVKRLDPAAPADFWLAATALATTAPLYWFSASRPLSDAMGLAAALAVQAMALAASTDRAFMATAVCAGLAAGIRSQVAWLTVPLLFHQGARRGVQPQHGERSFLPARSALNGVDDSTGASSASVVKNSPSSAVKKLRTASSVKLLASYGCGVLVWAVPLIILSGGPAGYVRALSSQGAEDFTGVRMLLTSPTARELINALYYSFVAPWATGPIATVMLLLSAIGCVALVRGNPRAAARLAIAFGPYLAFHIVFQETFTARYALPLVIPIACCAAAGACVLPRRAGLVVAALIVIVSAHVGGTSVAAYSRDRAPAFRLLDDMRAASTTLKAAPVLALDRREAFDLRRPIRWIGEAMAPVDRRLPAPPQHEWLELVKYWNGGGRAPVWLVVDPMRNAVDLIGRGPMGADPVRYRWRIPYPVLLSGVRPNEMDWYRIDRPEWYVGEGWALTPEAAGVSAVDRRGLSTGPIEGWISRDTLSGTLVVGGRNFDPAAQPQVEVLVNGQLFDQVKVAPGFFLRFIPLESAPDRPDFSRVMIRATPPSRVAIEQFDASSSRPVFGYGPGWQEPEFNPQNGLRWRWLSEHGELRVRSPAGASAVTLHLEGESPMKYFSRGSRLIVRAGSQALLDRVLTADFSIDVAVPPPSPSARDTTITLDTDQVFIPAEKSWRPSGDRRHLGLRIFKCSIRTGT